MIKCQSGDFANEFHRAAPAMTYLSLIKWSLLHELSLGWVWTNKASHWVKRTQCCITTGDQTCSHPSHVMLQRCSKALWSNQRQMLPLYLTPRAQRSQALVARASCHFCTPYEREAHYSDCSDRAYYLAEMPLFQLTPHICVAPLPEQAFPRIVFLFHNRNQLD